MSHRRRVSVDLAALGALIEYADAMRGAFEGEYLASPDEYSQSQQEFDDLIVALDEGGPYGPG